MRYRLGACVLALFVAAAASAADQRGIAACGTGATTTERARIIQEARRPERRLLSTANVQVHDGTFVVRADNTNVVGDRPFDLQNSSLVFRRTADGYALSKTPPRFAVDRGQMVRGFNGNFGPGWHFYRHELQAFAFPFAGQDRHTLYISAFNGITFSPPQFVDAEQFDELEIAGFSPEVISPLLLTSRTPRGLRYPNLSIRETAERVVITWTTPQSSRFGYDIQAILYRNGDIIFSYGEVKGVSWGAPVVSMGRDGWRSAASLGTTQDATNDVVPDAPATVKPQLDIRNATMSRLNESSMLEARIQIAQPISIAALEEGQHLVFVALLSNPATEDYIYAGIQLHRDGSTIVYHRGRFMENSNAARVEGDTVVFLLPQDDFSAASANFTALSGTSESDKPTDMAVVPIALGSAVRALSSNLSAATEAPVRALAFESFTVPALDVSAVWQQLKESHGLRDDAVDAVAVYQNFFTDIIFYASAYALSGNPQADGVTERYGYGTAGSRRPTLMHMNVLDYAWNDTAMNSGHVLLHEFGHRWLYGIRIMEGAERKRSLNPVSEHPAEYVHTPAAFPVFSSSGEASAMGGGSFRDNGDGTFTSGTFANHGYSWTDLYLMGLAAPHEVPSWFYIQNTDPPLDHEYYPPSNFTVSGTRREVRIDQVIGAMGPRTPAEAQSQKNFRVLFVLLTRDEDANLASQLDVIRQHREVLEQAFRKATGFRGSVSTALEAPPRSRPVRR